MGLLHGCVEFALGNVLDLFVDRENNVPARIRLFLDASQPVMVSVHRDQHLARGSAELLIEGPLQTAKTFIIKTYISQYLRCQLSFGIKTLRFLLEVDSAQVQRADALARFGIKLACNPAKGTRG